MTAHQHATSIWDGSDGWVLIARDLGSLKDYFHFLEVDMYQACNNRPGLAVYQKGFAIKR